MSYESRQWSELQTKTTAGDWVSVAEGPVSMMIKEADKLHIVMGFCARVVSEAGIHHERLDEDHLIAKSTDSLPVGD